MCTNVLKSPTNRYTLSTVNRIFRKYTITPHKNVSNKKKHKNKEIVDASQGKGRPR